MKKFLDQYIPLVAILRGVQPDEVLSVAKVLVDAGFEMIEVPLNSRCPIQSIKELAKHFGDQCLVGAGTVLTKDQVDEVRAVGGKLIVSPDTNVDVIKHAKAKRMICLPGAATPTESFTALKAGADGLKMFPASAIHDSYFKALSSVLPDDTFTFAVGGVNENNMQDYFAKGIQGIGFGSSLYKPGKSLDAIRQVAEAIQAAT